jgi:hypothetical protein
MKWRVMRREADRTLSAVLCATQDEAQARLREIARAGDECWIVPPLPPPVRTELAPPDAAEDFPSARVVSVGAPRCR